MTSASSTYFQDIGTTNYEDQDPAKYKARAEPYCHHTWKNPFVLLKIPLKKYIAISGRRILHEVENTAPWVGLESAFQGARLTLTHSEGTKKSWVGSYCPGEKVLQSWWGRRRF